MIRVSPRTLSLALIGSVVGFGVAAPARAQLGNLLADDGVTGGNGAGASYPSGQASETPRRERAARPRRSRASIQPYLELDQTAIYDLKGGTGDVLTYTSVAAGVSGSYENPIFAIGADLRYEHQFAWTGGVGDQDIWSGLVNGRVNVLRDMLTVEAGGLATRVRTDGFSGANNSLAGAGSTTRVYSAYVGPNLSAPIGDLTLTGAYRLGYTRLEDNFSLGTQPNVPLGSFDESWIHNASAAIGMQPGLLPFGWSVGAGYTYEKQSQLDQRFDDKWARLDLTVPIMPTLALVGGVGYEKIKIDNKNALFDANGDPVRDSSGRFVTDPASPRQLAYDQSGIIWDAGVLWRPSPRTSAEFRVGERYGSMSYTGRVSWQPNRRMAVQVTLFDSIDSFGRALNGSLANVPTTFIVNRNPFSGDLSGCALDGNGSAAGACFNNTLSGVSTANFRNRGIVAQFSYMTQPWTFTASAGYAQHKFITAGTSVLAGANGIKDENVFGVIGLSRQLGYTSGFDVSAYANYFQSGFSNGRNVVNAGVYGSYHQELMRRLLMNVSVGIDSAHLEGQDSIVTLLAQLGLRYQF